MFERRLKILSLVLAFFAVLLLGRIVQVQVLGRSHYGTLADEVMTQERTIPAPRGPILDVRGRPIAEDAACVDAAIDFRAVTRDSDRAFVREWVRQQALQRLRNRTDGSYTSAEPAERRRMRDEEFARVRADIDAMWARLAEISGLPPEEIEDARDRIDREVRLRKRSIVYGRYRAAVEQADSRPKPAWYERFLTAGAAGADDAPTEDEFDDELIWEQRAPHVVLRAIPPAVQNELGRNLDRFPGLVLQPSTYRVYPYRHVAAHAIGAVGRVQPSDLAGDPEPDNERRAYRPNDLAGRGGIEALAERMLRGTRGIERQSTTSAAQRIDPEPGTPVTSTLDMELQAQLRDLFTRVRLTPPRGHEDEPARLVPAHGAAVVIDVPTGEIRALVSFPDYDLNATGDVKAVLLADDVRRPLFNRATMSEFEPGSTVKPMVGLAALAEGRAGIDDRIECGGYLVLRNRRFHFGRCWTMSIDTVPHTHHAIPWEDPHRGPTPDLNGFLNFEEAVQRSCNIYFENMADRLGPARFCAWMRRFGFGRCSGLGIPEADGLLPESLGGPAGLHKTWLAGIGQGHMQATPLQVANAMATLARDGVWVRPTLVRGDTARRTPWRPSDPTRAAGMDGPDRVDLGIPPAALAACRRGMIGVVETIAGSGYKVLRRPDLRIAAKTGTAQASPFRHRPRDANGKELLDADGKRQWVTPRPGTWTDPNPEYPWYRASDSAGKQLHHAWMAGYAPADRPTVAFVVMVEYAGAGGGAAAGPVAAQLLEACIEHGYVPRSR